jgi:hypothetical protein
VSQPDKVAKAILAAARRPVRERSVGLLNPFIVFGFRALPAVYDALVTPLVRIAALSRRKVPPGPGNVLAPLPEGEAERGRWG